MTDYLHKLRWTTAVLCLLGSLMADAYDFMVNGLAYNLLDAHTVEVTSTVSISIGQYTDETDFPMDCDMWVVDGVNYYGSGARDVYPKGVNYLGLTGAVVIPDHVNHDGATCVVTRISDYAFAFTDITSVEMPHTVTVVGESAFEACEQLSSVFISDLDAWCGMEFKGGRLFGGWNDGLIRGGRLSSGNPTEYAHHLYLNGKEVTSVIVPEGISRLGYTFQNCVNLTEVSLPATVTDMGAYTFAGTGITRLPVTEAMTRIPEGAFSHCPNLPDTVAVPVNITSIESNAFSGSPIGCLMLHSGMNNMGPDCFESTGVRNIFSAAYFPPCHINSGGDYHSANYWTAFDYVAYREAVLHIPPGTKTNYSELYVNEYSEDWTWFEHVEEYGVPVEAIAFGQPSLTVTEATSAELTVFFTPAEWVDKRLRLASSNPAVATADSIGLGIIRVNALTPGRAVVTATTTDGSNLVASCVVIVTKQSIASIELNVDSAMLNIGEQLQLIATEQPSGMTATDVAWSSSNEAVATVTSSGKVTAWSPGETIITATLPDSLKATCAITVPVPATTGISLSKSELNLPRGDEYRLMVAFEPMYAESPLKWISSDVQVVSVDNNGKIKALREGLAVVSATTTDGTNLTASCLVTVYERVAGDLNADGAVDVDDLNIVINIMLGNDEPAAVADIDSNGVVDIDDLNIVINIMLGRHYPLVMNYTVGNTSFRMVHIEGGTFTMGATVEQGSDAASIEKPAHQVTLSSFGIGETEVTQALWRVVMGSNPSGFTSDGQLPVECVSYDDCQAFITKLSELTGEQFRLPTEAEWEYAARGGSQSKGSKYAGGTDIDAVGWCSSNADEATHPVAQKAANELGLYDMSGNVWEWCSDWYGPYDAVAQNNPTGPDSGTMRVCRGGGWHSAAPSCRTASRTYNVPTKATDRIGLRLAINRF